MIIGKVDGKFFWQEMVLRTSRILWIYGYWNILWSYFKANYIFWIHLTCKLLMWVCPCAMMLVITSSLWCVITLSLWWRVKLEGPTLHDMGKSLSVWVRLLPIGPKVHTQKGYCLMHHPLLPMGGRGKYLSVWVRLGRPKRLNAKQIQHGTLSLTTRGG